MAAPKITDERIVELYLKETPIKEIPASDTRIYRVIAEAGIPRRMPGTASASSRQAAIERRNRAIVEGYQDREAVGTLAKRHNCSVRVVRDVLRMHGFGKRFAPPKPPLGPETPRPVPPILYDPARASTRLRMRLVERANRAKLDAWKAAA